MNNLKQYDRWAFAEVPEGYRIERDSETRVAAEFDRMIEGIVKGEE